MAKSRQKDFKTFLVYLPLDVHKRIRVGAAAAGLSIHDFIVYLLSTSGEINNAIARFSAMDATRNQTMEVRAHED